MNEWKFHLCSYIPITTDITVGWMDSSVSPLLYFLLLVIFPPETLKCYDSGAAHTAANDNASYVITNQPLLIPRILRISCWLCGWDEAMKLWAIINCNFVQELYPGAACNTTPQSQYARYYYISKRFFLKLLP